MRSLPVALTILSSAALAFATAAPAAAPNPCKLTTAADVKAVFGASIGRGKLQSLGLYKSCSYTGAGFAVTIQTRPLSKSDFVKSAKMNPGPVKAVSGLGAPAYFAGRVTLLVWRHGNEATFTMFGSGSPLAGEIKLAKRALPRM